MGNDTLERKLRELCKPLERSSEGEDVPGAVWPSELLELACEAARLAIYAAAEAAADTDVEESAAGNYSSARDTRRSIVSNIRSLSVELEGL